MSRTATITRRTNETSIELSLNLDGTGETKIATGIGFLDHLLTAFARHGRIDLSLACEGDLHIDDHHTAEDCAIALGEAINKALSDKVGITRFGSAYAPLDEALARTVIDLSGRPHATINLALQRDRIGELACENITHVLQSLAMSGRFTLHIDVLRGENDHHKAEAAFKSFALAFRQAIAQTDDNRVPSTKGVLS